MKKDMPLEGLRWSRDSGSALYDTPQNGRSRTGWGVLFLLGWVGSPKPHPLLFPRKGLKNKIVYFCKLLRYEELCKPY